MAEKDAMRFKNYKPYDSSLVVQEPIETNAVVEKEEVSENKKDELDVIKRELAQYNGGELNIVPKKTNWDLKSQKEERMTKLKRKTQRAIVDILREKFAESGDDDADGNEIKDLIGLGFFFSRFQANLYFCRTLEI